METFDPMFEPGQRVICIDDSFPDGIRDIFNALPVKGQQYTVRDLVPGVGWKLNEEPAVYNEVRLHSAIGYVKPKDKLEGHAQEIGKERDRKLEEARQQRAFKRKQQHEQADRGSHSTLSRVQGSCGVP